MLRPRFRPFDNKPRSIFKNYRCSRLTVAFLPSTISVASNFDPGQNSNHHWFIEQQNQKMPRKIMRPIHNLGLQSKISLCYARSDLETRMLLRIFVWWRQKRSNQTANWYISESASTSTVWYRWTNEIDHLG